MITTLGKGLNPETFTPLSLTMLYILLSLTQGERHGYKLLLELKERARGQYSIGTASLYRAIEQLLVDGLIEEVPERPDPELDDKRRRYYRITDFGRDVLHSEASRIQMLVCEFYAKDILQHGRLRNISRPIQHWHLMARRRRQARHHSVVSQKIDPLGSSSSTLPT